MEGRGSAVNGNVELTSLLLKSIRLVRIRDR